MTDRALRLLAWPDYTLDEVHRRFEERTGVRIEYEHFDQNEDAFARCVADPGAFDVVFADGAWPVAYAAEGLVEWLSPSRFEGWAGVDPVFRALCVDGLWASGDGRTAAYPANFGLRGIVWDPRRVERPLTSWDDLWRKSLAGRVWINSQGSEIVAEAAAAAGIPDENLYELGRGELEPIADRLEELGRSLGGVWSVWSELERAFREHGAVAAEVHTAHLVWNLRAAHGVPYEVVVPRRGTIGWVDGAMIAKGSPLLKEAIRFVDFLFSAEGVELQWEHSDGYAPTNGHTLDRLAGDQRFGDKIAAIAEEGSAGIEEAVLYRPPADIEAYLEAWRGLLKACDGIISAEAWRALDTMNLPR